MDADTLRSALSGIERQIGDKQRQIDIDRSKMEQVRSREQVNIDSAETNLQNLPAERERDRISLQNERDRYRSKLDTEMQGMQMSLDRHMSDLQALEQQAASLRQQINDAEKRELTGGLFG